MPICYQCDQKVNYIFGDCRCKNCTRLTTEEITGEMPIREDTMDITVEDVKQAMINQLKLQENIVESQIGWDETFSEMGLDSLDMIELIMGVESELDTEFPRVLDELSKPAMLIKDLPLLLLKSIGDNE